ncbi:MAG: Holliday junction resolvase RuvX [Mycobacteriaceae bacterium]
MSSGAGPDRPGSDDPGRGRRIGVDVGSVRVGIASSDPDGILATPVETVARTPGSSGPDAPDLRRIGEIVAEYEAVEVVVGLPQTLRGEHGRAAALATEYADRLRRMVAPVPVRLSDERLTTVTASRVLAEQGVRGKRQRSLVDQLAAVAILQGWLDARVNAPEVEVSGVDLDGPDGASAEDSQ